MSNNDIDSKADKQNLIGVDPLAWLSDEEKASVINKEAENTNGNNANQVYSVNMKTAFTIRDATDILTELNAIDDKYNEIVFELEQLERVDAAALQLLLGFYLFTTEAGKKVVWHEPNDIFCDAVELLGLKDIIGLQALAA